MADGIAPTPTERLDLPSGTATGSPLLTLLDAWARHVREEQNETRDMIEAAVTMHVRARGVTVSDMVSSYGSRPETAGLWMQYDPNQDGEVHPINIIGPALTTNKNACLQSNAEIEISSANASAHAKQVAQRWSRVSDYFERVTWTEDKRGVIFDDTQKAGTVLIEACCDRRGEVMVPYTVPAQREITYGVCASCGFVGEVEDPKTEDAPCPECGGTDSIVTQSLAMDGYEQGEEKRPLYEIGDRVIPFFNFTVDSYGAKVGGLKTADWVATHDLKSLTWLRSRYPQITFGGPSRWSFKTRCDYALAYGRFQYLSYQPRLATWLDDQLRFEVYTIFLNEDAYSSWRSPSAWEFVNGAGKKVFEIRQGETIGEAQKRQFGMDPGGFAFMWTEDSLLDILSPEEHEVDPRNRFSDVHWNRESGSYLSAPNYSLIYLQDDLTLLNTLQHNIAARNAVNPIYFDSTAFEKDDFNLEYIGTKNAALLPDFDIRKAVTALPIPQPSPHLAAQMQWIWSIKDSVSLVTPAMRGETQKGQPFAAQRQQLEQSYGNLTSVLKSFAQCKIATFRNKARLAVKHWTVQQFQEVASSFGEQWDEEDVEAMRSIDFDRDLIISYRQGSEMPSTPIGREMKFFGALQQLFPFIQAFPQLLGTEKLTQIMQKIDEFGEFDFDLTGLEVNEMIAQKRYHELVEACAPYADLSYDKIIALKQEVVAQQPVAPEAVQQAIELAQSAPDDPAVQQQAQQLTTPQPITAYDLLLEEIYASTTIHFSRYEDLQQQSSFFVEMLRTEIGKPRENFMLIEILQHTLSLIEQAGQQLTQEAMAKDPQLQLAKEEEERAAAEAEVAHERDMEKMQAQAELAEATRARESEERSVERRDNAALDLLKTAAQQEHEMETAAVTAATKNPKERSKK